MKAIKYKFGIDVGGTTLDFAVVDSKANLLFSYKLPIVAPLEQSIKTGIQELISTYDIDPKNCLGIHIGTTIAINALLNLNSLYKVGILRIAGHSPELPPAYEFPRKVRRAIFSGYETISGGRELDNQAISNLKAAEIILAVNKLLSAGAEAVIREHFKTHVPITLSHQLGSLGFLKRENNILINTAPIKTMRNSISCFSQCFNELGFICQFEMTQNNGTLISFDEAIQFPLKTISSGPTNSLVGACKLTGLQNAIVVDIGGTSTDIGIVENAFPHSSSQCAYIADLPLSFTLPHLKILALGGGSIFSNTSEGYVLNGSLGAAIFSESQSVGGNHLTFFDIGNILNDTLLPKNHTIQIDKKQAEAIMQFNIKKILDVVDSLNHGRNFPVILVGGGAQNIPEEFLDKRFIRPKHYNVANAYGAALAEISGVISRIICLDWKTK
jgi:N-methylhydantoinase A/oxoprolinase/acetone carboxylase beta subunit